MREIFKSYHLFIPGRMMWIKMILLYILAPAAMLGLATIGLMDSSGVIMFACMSMPISVEMLIDMAVFGGIERKNSKQTVFLRLQSRGLTLLKKGLWGDFLRRVYVIIVPLVLALIICDIRAISVWRAVGISLSSLLLIELMLFVTRAIDSYTTNLLILSGFAGVTVGFSTFLFTIHGLGTVMETQPIDYVLTIVMFLLVGAEAFFRIRLSVKQAGKAYYD